MQVTDREVAQSLYETPLSQQFTRKFLSHHLKQRSRKSGSQLNLKQFQKQLFKSEKESIVETEASDFTIMFSDRPRPAHVKYKKVDIESLTGLKPKDEVKLQLGERPKRFLSRQISQSKLSGQGMFKSTHAQSVGQNPWQLKRDNLTQYLNRNKLERQTRQHQQRISIGYKDQNFVTLTQQTQDQEPVTDNTVSQGPLKITKSSLVHRNKRPNRNHFLTQRGDSKKTLNSDLPFEIDAQSPRQGSPINGSPPRGEQALHTGGLYQEGRPSTHFAFNQVTTVYPERMKKQNRWVVGTLLKERIQVNSVNSHLF